MSFLFFFTFSFVSLSLANELGYDFCYGSCPPVTTGGGTYCKTGGCANEIYLDDMLEAVFGCVDGPQGSICLLVFPISPPRLVKTVLIGGSAVEVNVQLESPGPSPTIVHSFPAVSPSRTAPSEPFNPPEEVLNLTAPQPLQTAKVLVQLEAQHPGPKETGIFSFHVEVVPEPSVENVTFVGPETMCDPAGGTVLELYGAELHQAGDPTVVIGGTNAPVLSATAGTWRRHASVVTVECPPGGGSDVSVAVTAAGSPSAVTISPGPSLVSYRPPFISEVNGIVDLPVVGGSSLYYLVGGAWGDAGDASQVYVDDNVVAPVFLNSTHIGVPAPSLGYQPSGGDSLTASVRVVYKGQSSSIVSVEFTFQPPTVASVTPGSPFDKMLSPIAPGTVITVSGSNFAESYGVNYTKLVLGGVDVPASEVNHVSDSLIEWTVGSDWVDAGCSDTLVVVRGNIPGPAHNIIWESTISFDHTSISYAAPVLGEQFGLVKVSGTNLGPLSNPIPLEVFEGDMVTFVTSLPLVPELSSANHRYYHVSDANAVAIAMDDDRHARFNKCEGLSGGYQDSVEMPLYAQASPVSSQCVVYLDIAEGGTRPEWHLHGQPLSTIPTDSQCRVGERLVIGWDLRPWSLQASACRVDSRESPGGGCLPKPPPIGGPSQFVSFANQAVCTTITNADETSVVANCVESVPANGESAACFSAVMYGGGLPTEGVTESACVHFGASAGAVTCEVDATMCSTTCFSTSDSFVSGTCPQLEQSTYPGYSTASECYQASSCTCACTFFDMLYRPLPIDFMPRVFNEEPTPAPTRAPTTAPTPNPTAPPTVSPTPQPETTASSMASSQTTLTATLTAAPSSTTAPDEEEALASYVYGIVTLEGESPYTLLGLPAAPLTAFAWRDDASQEKKRLVAPVDESFDPLKNIDYGRGPLADGDVVTDSRIVLRLPQQEGSADTSIPSGTALRYVATNGTETVVSVNDGALGRATDSRSPGSEIRNPSDSASLSGAEIALLAIACLGCLVLAGYVAQRARAGQAAGRDGSSKRDVEMAGTYTAPPRSSGSASTTLTPPESYEAPPTRGTKSTGSVTSDDPYSAPPSSNSAGGGPVEDAGTYDAPPVKLAANDTLRRRAKDEVPKKFVIAPTDLDKGKLIGQGGYGYVYRGVWREVAVAIKEIREVPDPKVSREAVKQMVEEAIMMCDLRPHTNLIQFFGICLDPISIVLEFAAKGALEDALYGRKKEARIDFTAEQRLAICLGAGRGVHHLHQEGVVHRDLAARNVLLTASLEPKLTDFGMAREGAEDEATTTATKVGPIRWMAPEQLSDQVVSTASDVWAFGALMYEVYACEQPFGKKKNMVVAKQVMDGGHCDIPASAPESVQQAMNACFEHDHEKRVKMKSILTMLEE